MSSEVKITPLKEWLEETFSKEFLEESEKQYMRAAIEGRDTRIAELESRLQDYEDDYKSTVNEKCDPEKDDRVHCTCVPHLKRRIKELEDRINKAPLLYGIYTSGKLQGVTPDGERAEGYKNCVIKPVRVVEPEDV